MAHSDLGCVPGILFPHHGLWPPSGHVGTGMRIPVIDRAVCPLRNSFQWLFCHCAVGVWALSKSPLPCQILYLRQTMENTLGASSKGRSLIGPCGKQASIIRSGAMEQLQSSVK